MTILVALNVRIGQKHTKQIVEKRVSASAATASAPTLSYAHQSRGGEK